jgi:hypothetical protein
MSIVFGYRLVARAATAVATIASPAISPLADVAQVEVVRRSCSTTLLGGLLTSFDGVVRDSTGALGQR